MIKDILDDLASNNSRLYKEQVLQQEVNNPTLQQVIELALNPFMNFYIKKIPEYTLNLDAKNQDPLDQALIRLNLLSNRTLTGNAGIDHLRIILSSVSVADAQVIERIIAKDLRCGVSSATVNKIWPGLIPEYPCMLASAFDAKLLARVSYPAFAQLKMDGMRFNAIVKNGKVEFRSRNGKEINIPNPDFEIPFRFMAQELGLDLVFDGELVVAGPDGRPLDRKTGNGILNKAVKGTMSVAEAVQVRASVWDLITLSGFQAGVESVPYNDRLTRLYTLLDALQTQRRQLSHLVEMVYTTKVDNEYQAKKIFEDFLADGQEGIILKTRDGIWENKRSKHLIKFKGELECDLRVVDWEEGTGKNVGRLGALVLESDCGGIRVNVGTGFSDADRDSINHANSVGRIVAVKYNSRISDKSSGTESLFLPVFVEFRTDKNQADMAKDIK
jgi:hypothetical protein